MGDSSKRVWEDYRIFHTGTRTKLGTYSKEGELAIIATASFKGCQYAISIATSVIENTPDTTAR